MANVQTHFINSIPAVYLFHDAFLVHVASCLIISTSPPSILVEVDMEVQWQARSHHPHQNFSHYASIFLYMIRKLQH